MSGGQEGLREKPRGKSLLPRPVSLLQVRYISMENLFKGCFNVSFKTPLADFLQSHLTNKLFIPVFHPSASNYIVWSIKIRYRYKGCFPPPSSLGFKTGTKQRPFADVTRRQLNLVSFFRRCLWRFVHINISLFLLCVRDDLLCVRSSGRERWEYLWWYELLDYVVDT